ncbi:MAG TPA: cytochrome c oxidase subunit 3 [Candidatus Caenarcaniphilales bacterium]|nr:cytochrome c oxidase subunit 3 [Candidatus Caenarcaniphilales bacterium]
MTAGTDAVHVPRREEDPHGGLGHAEQGTNTALLGMLLFIGSEIMFFAGLFAAYFNSRAAAPEWPPAGVDFIQPLWLPVIATTILVISSVTMQWAVWRIRKGDRVGMNRAIAVTLLLGVVFLGMQLFDYAELLGEHSFGINSGVYGTLFYTLTGFHGAHVFGGIVGISVILLRGIAGQFSARHHIAVEAVSAYWHFVDVVWIALFVTLYLLQ